MCYIKSRLIIHTVNYQFIASQCLSIQTLPTPAWATQLSINKGHFRAPEVAAADYVNTSSSLRSAVGLHFSGIRNVPVDVSAQARYM